MKTLATFLSRNKVIAAEDLATGKLQPSLPDALVTVKAVVIGCADMRADPAHLLGLEPGEAVVMRNIGGRVTPGLLELMGLLGKIGQNAGKVPGGGGEFNLVVLHHTDCGILRLADETALLTKYFQVDASELPSKAVRDPRAAVAADVAALRAVPGLPGEWITSGLVYDVSTGLVEVVVPASPIRM